MSPSSSHAFSFHKHVSKHDKTHLIVATTLDRLTGPKAYLATAHTQPKEDSKMHTDRKRSSNASTTEPRLRHSHHTLFERLQKIQTELAAHRLIKLDTQTRLSHINHCSPNDAKATAANRSLEPEHPHHPPAKRATNATPESQTWWEACQIVAHNCDTPFNATEFFKTPRPVSGFDFNFDASRTTRDSAPLTPEVDAIPSLSPASSDRAERSDAGGTHEGPGQAPDDTRFPASAPALSNDRAGSDVIEHIVEFDGVRVPAPPRLQSPPRSRRSRSASARSVGDDITALPEIPPPPPPPPVVESSQRCHKGVRSLLTYKALLKGKVEKGKLVAVSQA